MTVRGTNTLEVECSGTARGEVKEGWSERLSEEELKEDESWREVDGRRGFQAEPRRGFPRERVMVQLTLWPEVKLCMEREQRQVRETKPSLCQCHCGACSASGRLQQTSIIVYICVILSQNGGAAALMGALKPIRVEVTVHLSAGWGHEPFTCPFVL